MSARTVVLLSTVLFLVPPAFSAPASPGVANPEIAGLSWLTGCWASSEGGRLIEECWLNPAGGMMLGFNRTVSENGSAFEFLRLGPHLDGIAYYASPSGREAVPFVLIESSDGLAVFANPGHDFPQRLTYRLEGDRLSARVEALDGEEWKGFELVLQRSTIAGPGDRAVTGGLEHRHASTPIAGPRPSRHESVAVDGPTDHLAVAWFTAHGITIGKISTDITWHATASSSRRCTARLASLSARRALSLD